MSLARTSALVMAALALVGCGPQKDSEIGYSHAPESETESAPEGTGTGRREPRPAGGAGFEFGSSADQVRAKCQATGGEFKNTGDVSSCTMRHEKAGATAITVVEYRKKSVCRIHSVAMLDAP